MSSIKCKPSHLSLNVLTHWGRVTHICIGNLTIIGSDNGLSLNRRQAIIRTNVGTLLIGPLATNFGEIFIEIHTFSFMKMHLNISSGKWRPSCLGLSVLILDMLNLVYLERTKSIPWLLIPWLLASPGHQQAWYWQYKNQAA